ncbi:MULTISPECIES: ATPase inhibitor subunit zeta [Methylobacterium]|uniref:DUF1476 domain-containing protein n=2 Tax=Pseudomonadota TaxID=1224 RepID=A0ABQ4SXX2_9HYPH|nr:MULTISPECIES: ATPase inhibitor subunit zeta [Methylobacterium]GBU17060.1 hypothetical protein AwMethylo_12750 [Methylobacterium sp.]GJE06669.1 hypothetical protein AOPFMNJM_1991 [Methylobacterium jeotgali]
MGRLFEDRERAEELLFARSEEARFLAHCNALRKLAAYAGERRGLDMQATETYAETLISLSVEGHRDAELLEQVRADIAARNDTIDASEMTAVFGRCLASAAEEMRATR